MRLDELLDVIDHESEIALQVEGPDEEISKTSVREVWKLLNEYGGDENFIVRDVVQQDDELPFK